MMDVLLQCLTTIPASIVLIVAQDVQQKQAYMYKMLLNNLSLSVCAVKVTMSGTRLQMHIVASAVVWLIRPTVGNN